MMSSLPLRAITTMAWRNLWRNYRRTLIMLLAITVGVWAMIFMTALLRGMVDEMVRGATNTLLGHVQIHHNAYVDDPSIVNSMPPPSAKILAVLDGTGLDVEGLEPTELDSTEIVAWTTRVRVPAVVSSEYESLGVSLVGINPSREVPLSFIDESIVEGRNLNSTNDHGIVIGARLAERLDTELGKRIVLMSQDPDNNIVDSGVRIVGIYHTDPATIEESLVFVGLKRAQQLLNMGQQISELEVLGKNYRETDVLLTKLKAALDENQVAQAWHEQDGYMGSMLTMMDGFILVWIIVVFLTLSFGLVNTLMMAVFERMREIGLVLALGMRPYVILLQVLIESLLLLLLGLLLGNTLAWLSIAPLQDGIDISAMGEGLEMAGMSSVLYPSLQIEDMLLATVVVVVMGLLASLYPAWRASRCEPVQALSKT